MRKKSIPTRVSRDMSKKNMLQSIDGPDTVLYGDVEDETLHAVRGQHAGGQKPRTNFMQTVEGPALEPTRRPSGSSSRGEMSEPILVQDPHLQSDGVAPLTPSSQVRRHSLGGPKPTVEDRQGPILGNTRPTVQPEVPSRRTDRKSPIRVVVGATTKPSTPIHRGEVQVWTATPISRRAMYVTLNCLAPPFSVCIDLEDSLQVYC